MKVAYKIEDIQDLKYQELFILHCENCEQEFQYKCIKRYKLRKKLLCRYCNMKQTRELNMNYSTTDIDTPIEVKDSDMILNNNFKYGQKLLFNCKGCGKQAVVKYRKYKKEVYSELYCNVCNIKRTLINRYGVENATYISDHNEKVKRTCMKKYGSMCPPRSHNLKLDNIYFDSSWEMSFYLYWKEKGKDIKREPCYFEYQYRDKTYRYFPDFEIEGMYYEVKGNYFFHKIDGKEVMYSPYNRALDEVYEAKHQCMKEHNVIIIKWEELSQLLGDISIWNEMHKHIIGYVSPTVPNLKDGG